MRADAQCERQYRRGGEAFVLEQHSHGITQVLKHFVLQSLVLKRVLPSVQLKGARLPLRLCVNHSCRSATIGSTFVARRAGNQQANRAIAISNKTIPANDNGSRGPTSDNKPPLSRGD